MRGSCECGSVVFESRGPWRDAVACHCGQCRKTSGHYWASTSVPESALNFLSREGLDWYDSSDIAKRGFCGNCGSSLFYKKHTEDRVAIGAGTLDGPTDLTTDRDIFVEDKGDYYEVGGPAGPAQEATYPMSGSCECGAVTFEVTKAPTSAWYCHCDQCRKASGHFWAGAQLVEDGYRIKTDDRLRWYQSTDVVKKGYCNGCGSTLFWWLNGRAAPAVSAGALDAPTGLTIGGRFGSRLYS